MLYHDKLWDRWHVEHTVQCQDGGGEVQFVSPKIDHPPRAGEVIGVVVCCLCERDCAITLEGVQHHALE